METLLPRTTELETEGGGGPASRALEGLQVNLKYTSLIAIVMEECQHLGKKS